MSAAFGTNNTLSKTNYLDDINDYLEATADRIKNDGPISLIGKIFTGKIKSFKQFKSALRTSVTSVLQSLKEGVAWATVGLSIANERLGKLAWAALPKSFREPLPKIVKEHMESSVVKLLDEVRDQANPMVDGPKDDMRRKVHLRRALNKWRAVRREICADRREKCVDAVKEAASGLCNPSPMQVRRMAPGM